MPKRCLTPRSTRLSRICATWLRAHSEPRRGPLLSPLQEDAPVIEIRIVKVIMVGCLAIFASLVTFDNLADYDSNFEFVRHVLSMDTTFPGNALLYRRVTSPALWEAAYHYSCNFDETL